MNETYTFREFLEEIGKITWYAVKMLFKPKSLGGWIVEILVVIYIIAFALGIILLSL